MMRGVRCADMTDKATGTEADLRERRERVFLVLSGLFLGTLAMLNILGISRFIDLSFDLGGWRVPMVVAVGVLPYPVTFLCTDLISEIYGRERANSVVWMGLFLNIWVMSILWLGGTLPGSESPVYEQVTKLAFGAVAASMVAYMTAQFCDVQLFHFWKRLTKGKHLWLRNNASTLASQLVDTTAVILITHYYAQALPIDESQPIGGQLIVFIASGYVFKAFFALLDTLPLYWLVRWLRGYLHLSEHEEVGTLGRHLE
jgi:hypothetical protein